MSADLEKADEASGGGSRSRRMRDHEYKLFSGALGMGLGASVMLFNVPSFAISRRQLLPAQKFGHTKDKNNEILSQISEATEEGTMSFF